MEWPFMASEVDLGEKIRQARAEADLSQRELASRAGLSIQALSALENGRQLPRISSLIDIALATDKPVPWFFVDATPAAQSTSLPTEFVAQAWSREHLRSRGSEEPGLEAITYLAEAVASYEKSRPEWLERARQLSEDGAKALKRFGLAKPEQVFNQMTTLVGPALMKGLGQQKPPPECGLMGRDSEMGVLQKQWSAVAQGEGGQAVFVSGPSGIGKTRLLLEFAAQIEGKALECDCRSLPTDSGDRIPIPLYPLLDLIRRGLAEEPAISHLEKLRAELQSLELETLMPLTCAVLTLPLPAGLEPLSLSSEGWRRTIADGVYRLLERLSAQGPLLLVVDDLQWIDPTSLFVLDHLLSRLHDINVLLCLAARSEYDAPRKWSKLFQVVNLPLQHLSKAASLDLVQELASRQPLSGGLTERLLESAGGSPLLLEQATRSLLENLRSTPAASQHSWSLEDTLGLRVHRLSLAAQIVAQLLATADTGVSLATLEEIAPVEPPRIRTALGELSRSKLVLEVEGEWRLSHDKLSGILYRRMHSSVKRQHHERIAWSLFRGGFDRRAPETVAFHFGQAGFENQALELWIEAARRAIRLGADREAVAHLCRALEILDATPDRSRELSVRLLLAPRKLATEGYGSESVREEFERILALCEQVEIEETGLGLWCAFLFHLVREELQQAESLAQRCLELAGTVSSESLGLEAELGLGACSIYLGRPLEEGKEFFQSGLAASDQLTRSERLEHVTRYGQDPRVAGRGYYAWNRVLAGEGDIAVGLLKQALGLAEGHPFSLACAHHFATIVYRHLGQPKLVLEHATQELQISEKEGFPLWLAGGFMFSGWAKVFLGHQDGFEDIEQGLRIWRSTGAAVGMPFLLSLKIEALMQLGRHSEALLTLDTAQQHARDSGDSFYDPELLRLRAAALSHSDRAQARKLCRQAMAKAEPQGALLFAARAMADATRYGLRPTKAERELKKRLDSEAASIMNDAVLHFPESEK